MKKLVTLHLNKTRLDDGAIEFLKGHPALKVLELSDTAITDNAGPILATIPNLEDLYIGGTNITAKTFRELRHNKQLRTLFITEVVIDSNAALALGELTQLDKLFLGGKRYLKITDIEYETLKSKLKPDGVVFLTDGDPTE